MSSRRPSSKSDSHMAIIEQQIDRVLTLTQAEFRTLLEMLVEIETNARLPQRERTRAAALRARVQQARQGWGRR